MYGCIWTGTEGYKQFLAASIGTNPIIIRKLHQHLKVVNLIEVQRGTGGVTALKSYDKIIFLDIYNAVECNPENELFHFLENPNEKCPVGRNIHNILDDKLSAVQRAMESELSKLTLQHIIDDAKACVKSI